MKNKILSLIGFIFICELAGILGAFSTASSVTTWYAGLLKPALNPPNWVFGPVWTTLYAMMGVAAWLVYQSQDDKKTRKLKIFMVHLLVNAVWSYMFFGLKSTFFGFVWIILLDVFVAWVLIRFWKNSKLAGALLLPYVLWVSFATYLSFNLWWLNR